MITRALTNSEFSNQNKARKRVIYLDTDTTFTAYLTAGLILKNNQTSDNMNSMSDHKSNPANNGNNNNNKGETNYNFDDNRIISTKFKYRDERLVQVFLPSEGRFESLLGDAIASMPEASIVIFDSLNSFYNMYPGSWYETETIEEEQTDVNQGATRHETRESNEKPRKSRETNKKSSTYLRKEKSVVLNTTLQRTTEEKEIGQKWSKPKSPYTVSRLNHLLSIFIMLLVQHGILYRIPVLVTSMVRYKKVSDDTWVKAPACSRLLNQKSVVKLSIEMLNDSDLSVKIMKHPLIEQQTIVYPNVGISLVR